MAQLPDPSEFSASPLTPPEQPSFRRYHWWEAALVGLAMFGFVGSVFTFSSIGLAWWFGWWGALLYACVRDWRGVASLRGLIPWRRFPLIITIVLAVPVVALYPLLSCVYGARIIWSSLPAQVTNAISTGVSRLLAAMRRWPLAWRVASAAGALILVCSLCVTGLTIIGANNPSASIAVQGTPTRTSSPQNLTAHTDTHPTATAQAPHVASPAATATVLPTPTSPPTVTPQEAPTPSPTAPPAPTPTATPQPAPAVAPVQAPTATPRPQPTNPPPPPPPPPKLDITVTCASAVDYSSGQICVHTLPGAQLTIDVTYCSHYEATSRSLQGTVMASSSGDYTWSWTPETKCRGTATASITARWNGQQASVDRAFTVQ